MISIRKTVDELERLEERQRVTASCYGMAIRSAAEYAVELDPAEAESFRKHLTFLQESLETVTENQDFEAIQSSFRGELRDYRDKAVERLHRMRTDLESAAAAMQTLADNVSANGCDQEKELSVDLQKLKKAVQEEDISKIRGTVREVTDSIARSFEQMHHANQLAFAQLNDEIRSLHREMDNERKTLQTDRISGAWNRDKIEDRIDHLLQLNEKFSVLIARLGNFKQTEKTCSRTVMEGTLKALVKRILGAVGPGAMVGRWSTQEFAVILEIDPASAIAISAELSRTLSTRYVVEEDGISRHLMLRVASGVVDHPAEGDARRFHEQLEQLSSGLAGV